MDEQGVMLPPGYALVRLEETDSTNSEALKRAGKGEASGLWICANRQTGGKGRSGRSWHSEEGNLFASLVLRPECSLDVCPQLAFVAGIAAYEAVRVIDEAGRVETIGKLQLKWPNDLLLDGAKLGGILLESQAGQGSDDPAIVIGTGINIASHPDIEGKPATSLSNAGSMAGRDAVLQSLVSETARWVEAWDHGRGWEQVREEWMTRSIEPGTKISVKLPGETIQGHYAGLAADGALRLQEGGKEHEIRAGDVFLI